MRRLILFLPLLLLSAAPPWHALLPIDRPLADGVIHRHIVTERGEVVNILLVSLRQGARLVGIQGEERYDGVEDLRSIYGRLLRDRVDARVIAAVNAGAWRPDRLTPIGPRIVGSELVDIESFHEWPSLVISTSGRAMIAQLGLSARISPPADAQ
jgi:hypothetical protein